MPIPSGPSIFMSDEKCTRSKLKDDNFDLTILLLASRRKSEHCDSQRNSELELFSRGGRKSRENFHNSRGNLY